jgi:hypothetical protein
VSGHWNVLNVSPFLKIILLLYTLRLALYAFQEQTHQNNSESADRIEPEETDIYNFFLI